MNRRWIAGLTALSLAAAMPLRVSAEGDSSGNDYTNTSYWNNLCTNTSSLSAADQQRCTAYMQYMQSQNSSLQAQIDTINSQKDTLSTNITELSSQISSYNTQISSMNAMINDLNSQIADAKAQVEAKQQQIDDSQKQIDQKTDDVNALRDKVKERICTEQSTMRTSSMLDVLLGAKSFDDLLRIANGLSDISASDTYSLTELNDSITQLNDMKTQLEQDQEELKQNQSDLESGMAALSSQQASLLAAKYQVDLLQKQYKTQLASANSQIASAQSAISSNSSAIGSISSSISSSQNSGSSSSSGSSGTSSSGSSSGSSSSGSSSGTSSGTTSGDSSSNPYWGGWVNCTWSAWQLAHDTLGVSLPGWGNPSSWIASASRSGYGTGSSPAVNSIAVYTYHVAFVTQVSGDRVYIREGGYMGGYHERWVSASGLVSGQTCLGYIYL